jgi:hypothetical protein
MDPTTVDIKLKECNSIILEKLNNIHSFIRIEPFYLHCISTKKDYYVKKIFPNYSTNPEIVNV